MAVSPTKTVTSLVVKSSTVKNLSFTINTLNPVESTTSSSNPPLALLLGWYASSPKQVAKYSTLYNKMGFNTVALTLPHNSVFGTPSAVHGLRSKIAVDIESVLTSSSVPAPPSVVAHVFSNGGVFGLNYLLPGTTPFLWSKLKGIITDSAPCYLHATSGARAVSYGITGSPFLRSVIAAALLPVFYVPALAMKLAGAEDIGEEFWNRCKDYPFEGPMMYFYSDGDLLCDVKELVSRNRSGRYFALL